MIFGIGKERGQKSKGPIIVAITSDEHINSRVGLCPTGSIQLGEGSYLPSRAQNWLWNRWKHDFWKRIGDLKKELGAQVWWMHGGDGADDNTHSKYGLITPNKSIILRMAVDTFEPAVQVSDRRFFVRGTSAHVGQEAELEETIAMECGAEQCGAMYSQYVWKVSANDTLIMVRHKPISTATREHTRGGGAIRCAVQMVMEAARTKRPLPHLAFFGHFHHPEDSGENHPVRAFLLPCWKLHGSYEKYFGFSVEPVGGRVVICYPNGTHNVLPLKDWTYLPEEEGDKWWMA